MGDKGYGVCIYGTWEYGTECKPSVVATPTHEESLGLTVSVWKPAIASYDPRGTFVGSYEQQVSSYSHVSRAMGGYWSAKFTIKDRQEDLESWFDDGLGRHVEVYNPALECIWEGFVNQVDLSLGDLSATRGPLLSITNRVRVVYSTVDYSTDPPTVGVRDWTAWDPDTDSQGRFGIIEKVLSAGGMTAANATQVGATYLEENKEPKTTHRLAAGSGQQVVVHCLGYVAWMNAYTYYNAATGEIDADAKVADLLDGDPNGILSSANSWLESNTLQVPDADEDYKTAWTVAKAVVAQGDANDDRWLFGIYSGREAVYRQAPATVAYVRRLSAQSREITTFAGNVVRPWDVQPGNWLFLSDFLIGRSWPVSTRLDPRFFFIESTTYTAPYSLSLTGGNVDTIPQKLAKLGLAGVGT